MADTIYKKGSKGPEVGEIQTWLGKDYTDLGGTVDNDYGSKTHDAVWNWQERWNRDHNADRHINVDGIVGPETYPLLKQWYEENDGALKGVNIVEPAGTSPDGEGTVAKPEGEATGVKANDAVAEFAAGKAAANGTPAEEPVVPGNLQGETVAEFAAGKAAANGTAGGEADGGTSPDGEGTVAKPDGEASGVVTGGTVESGQAGGGSAKSQQPSGASPVNHLFDYANNSLESIMNSADGKATPKRQLLDDYFKWCQEKGQPIDYVTVHDIVNRSWDLSKSPNDEEKERKAAERKAKFDQIGNFLLHLGNAIGNVAGGGYGAVKLEDPVQFTERQRLLKEKAEQQRLANNQSIWAMMQKERADQRAQELARQQEAMNRQKMANETRKLDQYDEAQRLKNRIFDWQMKYQQGRLDIDKEKLEIEREYKNKKITLDERNTAIRELNAYTASFNAHAAETTEVEKDGKKITTTKKKVAGGNRPARRNRRSATQL